MIVTSPLLAGLARSGALASASDRLSDLEVLNSITPVIVLPNALDTINEPALAATINSVSVRKSDVGNVTNNAGGADTPMLTLGKGLWRINVFASLASNFVMTGTVFFSLKMTYPGGAQTMKLFSLFPCGGPAITLYTANCIAREFDVLIPLDGAQITLDKPPSNAVATNNLITVCDILCSKLA